MTTTIDTRCPRCGVTIRWTVTLAGARLAIDPTSHADGVVVPVWVGGELRAKVLTGNELPAQTAAYLPHERTCVKGRQRARRAGLRKPRCPWCEALMDPWLVDQGARGHVNCMSERAWQSSNLSVKGAVA